MTPKKIIKLQGSWQNKWLSVNGTQLKPKESGLPFVWGNQTNSCVITCWYILYHVLGKKRLVKDRNVRSFHRKIISKLPQTDFIMSVDITEFI